MSSSLSGLGRVVLVALSLHLGLPAAPARAWRFALVEAPAAAPVNTPRVSDSDKDKPLVDRVHHVMESKRLYAQTGLTIGMLASSVSMQEYRLRRLINQKLHYRNFNQYLNQYRIAEAARRLQDPAEITLSISSIALDVGYASLSSFNKAFKEVHGVTPSIYRSRAPQ
jgi:AraC-like DNA-binding protein